MPSDGDPRNLGISRQLAIVIAGAGTTFAVMCIAITVIIYGVDENTLPVILPLMGTLGVVVVNLASALKSAEAADTASRAKTISEYTASQNAAIHQALTAHCGEMCPLEGCPLRATHRRPK